MRRVANAQIVITAPVEVAGPPAVRGATTAGLAAQAVSRKTAAEVGRGALGLGVTGTGVTARAVTGRCVVGVAATKTNAPMIAVLGRCTLGVAARGTQRPVRPATGRCVLGVAAAIRPASTQPEGIYAGRPVYRADIVGQESVVPPLPPSYTLDIVCGQPLQVLLPVLAVSGAPLAPSVIASARAQVRVDWTSPAVLYEWTTTGSSPNAAVGAGGVTLTATTAETVNWQVTWPASVVWDLQVVDTSGVEHRLTSAGPIRLHPAITR